MRQHRALCEALSQPLSAILKSIAVSQRRLSLVYLLIWGSLVAMLLLGPFSSSPTRATSPSALDSFDVAQAELRLTAPEDIGTTASSTASGAEILGGERDLKLSLTGTENGTKLRAGVISGTFSLAPGPSIEGSARLEWDGPDGDAEALDPTGLDSVDLTSGGEHDAFLLTVSFDDNPIDYVLEVFTDESHSSILAATLPGGIITSTATFVLPFDHFSPNLGGGAVFSDVGAIALDIEVVRAPDLVLDSLDTTSTLRATKSGSLLVDSDGNDQPSPGDTLQYVVTVTNADDDFDAEITGVVFSDTLDLNTTLVISSVTTSQGTVSSGNEAGDTAVGVDIGPIADGASVTIQFEATISASLPAGVTEITNQGLISTETLSNLPTDDPETDAIDDATTISIVSAPILTATKADEWLDEGDGQLGTGDLLTYTVVITNSDAGAATGVVFSDTLDSNTSLITDSVTTSRGTVTRGNGAGDSGVQVEIGNIDGTGDKVTIVFEATIEDPLPAGVSKVVNQGAVSGDNFATVTTDDPDTTTSGDPTSTP